MLRVIALARPVHAVGALRTIGANRIARVARRATASVLASAFASVLASVLAPAPALAPALALLVTLMALGVPAIAAAQTAVGSSRLIVMPFESAERDPRLVWLREASAVLVSENLRTYGFAALSRDERVRAFHDLNLPSDASLSEASVIRVGQLVGASDVITGTLRLTGTDLAVDARRIRLDTGRIQQEAHERGTLRDLFAVHDRVTRTLMGGAATTIPSAASNAPPLDAFEQYIKGLVAEQPNRQIRFLQAALTGYPAYDRPRLALWEAYTEQGDHAKALAAVQGVPASSRLNRQARFRAALSLVALKRLDDAFTTLKALLDEQPTAPIYNSLGVVQLRRGGTATPQSGKPTYFFTKASEADPDESDYFFNLGYAYWLDKDTQASIYWLRESVRRNPADGDAHFVLGTALLAAGSQSEAAREKELARQLSSKYEEWTKRQAATGEAVPRALERLSRDIDPHSTPRLDATLLGSAQREQRELATFHLERGRRLYEQEQNREALAELQKAVYLSPYEAEPHLLIGRIYLRTGRPREAIDALRISIWSQETADAHLALGQALLQTNDRTTARSEADRAVQLAPSPTSPVAAAARALLSKIEQGPKKE
jgi:tetratricopeptide (TPR) repeat protein